MNPSPITGMVPRVNASVPATFDLQSLDPAQRSFTEAMCTENPQNPLTWEELLWVTTPHSLMTREPLGSLMLTMVFRPTIDTALLGTQGTPDNIRHRVMTRTRMRLARIHNQPEALLDRWLDELLELLFEQRLTDEQWQAIAHQVDLFGFSLRHYIDLLDLPNGRAVLDGVAPRTMPVGQSIKKSQLMFKGLQPRQHEQIEWIRFFQQVQTAFSISKMATPIPYEGANDDFAAFLGMYRKGLSALHTAINASD